VSRWGSQIGDVRGTDSELRALTRGAAHDSKFLAPFARFRAVSSLCHRAPSRASSRPPCLVLAGLACAASPPLPLISSPRGLRRLPCHPLCALATSSGLAHLPLWRPRGTLAREARHRCGGLPSCRSRSSAVAATLAVCLVFTRRRAVPAAPLLPFQYLAAPASALRVCSTLSRR